MNKLAIAVLSAALTALTMPAFAANNNAQQNAAADAGMEAPGAHAQMAPQDTNNNDINTSGSTMSNGNMHQTPTGTTRGGNGTPTGQIEKNMPCNGVGCTNNMGKHHSDSAHSDSSHGSSY